LDWAVESNQELVLLLLDFEKAFDRIEWNFLSTALSKLSFNNTWVRWVRTLYLHATSAIRINGEAGPVFQLARSVHQGCPLAPYLFILATDVLGHMLKDPRYDIKGLNLPRGGRLRDQTFADDTTLYLKGDQANLDRAQGVLETFCITSSAKVNWNKFVAIWANRRERTWTWGQEVGLKWIPKGEGVRYLGVQVGFRLPTKANFDKMMTALKGKLINWSHSNLSLAGRILIANQVLMASMWYMVASWNPNPKMCSQVRGVVRNFIWGGKDAPSRAKVKWDTLTLPIAKGGMGIIDPKTQSEVLLTKLLVRGLAPSGEPWKELIRHHVDQTKLPVHGKGPDTPNINWIFATPKLKRTPYSMWKSILGAWINVRPGLTKEDPANRAELLKQPFFENPSLTNSRGVPLGVNGQSKGCAFAWFEHTRIRELWNREAQEWKNLFDLGMHFHASNRASKDIILESIPG
jgi:hypothetical protein